MLLERPETPEFSVVPLAEDPAFLPSQCRCVICEWLQGDRTWRTVRQSQMADRCPQKLFA